MKTPKPNTVYGNILKRMCEGRMHSLDSLGAQFSGDFSPGSVSVYDFNTSHGKYGSQPITKLCNMRVDYPWLNISSKRVEWKKDGKLKKCHEYRLELCYQEVREIYSQLVE